MRDTPGGDPLTVSPSGYGHKQGVPSPTQAGPQHHPQKEGPGAQDKQVGCDKGPGPLKAKPLTVPNDRSTMPRGPGQLQGAPQGWGC